jgi:hypothetical protein
LSVLAALAEFPARIKKLFVSTEANEYGIYSIKVWNMNDFSSLKMENIEKLSLMTSYLVEATHPGLFSQMLRV